MMSKSKIVIALAIKTCQIKETEYGGYLMVIDSPWKSICFGYSLELYCSVDFNEYPQPMFQWRIVENDG